MVTIGPGNLLRVQQFGADSRIVVAPEQAFTGPLKNLVERGLDEIKIESE